MLTIPVPVPPEDHQRLIVGQVDTVEHVLDELAAALSEVDRLRAEALQAVLHVTPVVGE